MVNDGLEDKLGDSDYIELPILREGKPVRMLKKDFKKSTRSFVENYLAEREEMTRYFDSDEFNQLLDIIREYDSVDQGKLAYGEQVIEGLSAEAFGKICNTVYHNLESDVVKNPESSPSKFYIDHKDIRFHLMTDQGSTFWTTKME